MMGDKQDRESVSETSAPSEDNITTLTPSFRTTMQIASEFWPANNARGSQNQRNLKFLFPQKNITQKNTFYVQKANYYNGDLIVTDKECLDHNVKFPICHHEFLKPFTITSHRRHGHKNILTFRNLIASATDSLLSLSIFLNFDETTMDYIIVDYEATNLMDGIVNSRSGTDISSETE